jgi:predicted metal-dependent peptidase
MLSIGKTLSVEQRLQKAVVDIMANQKYIALAGILMIGERDVTDDPAMPTACTNGKNEIYNREFCEQLNDAELRFLILHENYHKLYRHMITWQHLKKEDQERANKAMDFVINIKLVDDNKDKFATMTGILEKGCLKEKYRDWDTARVYKDLPESKGRCGGNGEDDGQGGFDVHDWDGAEGLTAQEKNELARDIDEAIRQGALIAGKVGNGADRDLTKLLKPQIDWRAVLREFVKETCAGKDFSTWKKPNRRFIASDIYMPSGLTERVEGIAVGGDMSGSIGQHEQAVILTEVSSMAEIVKPSWLRMLYWDTEVVGDEKYEMHELDNFVKSTKPVGGGGTDPSCVPVYLNTNKITPQCVIMITDGYVGSWGNWNYPVLWVIIDNESAKPSVGKYVHVQSHDLC